MAASALRTLLVAVALLALPARGDEGPRPRPAPPGSGRRAARAPAPGPFQARVRARLERQEAVERALSTDELRRVPGASGDAIRAVQSLPGVARSPFGAGQVVIWGAAPGDTRVYADGVQIPRVFHFGGLRATIHAELVSELTFRPGAYGADFGRGLGGLIQITTRRPRGDRWQGSVTLDLIDGSVVLEGPVTRRLSAMAGARVSLIGLFLPYLSPSPRLRPFYWDYQLALRYRASDRDDLDLLVFGSTSDITAQVDDPDPSVAVNIASKSYFGRARLRWTHRFAPGTTLTVMPSLGGDTFRLDTGAQGVGGQQIGVSTLGLGYNLRAELTHRPGPLVDLAVGLDFEGQRSAVDAVAPGGPPAPGGEGQGVPAGSGDVIRDAGRAEGAFLGDRLFSPTAAAALRERSVYHLVQAAPYLIARFHVLGGRLLVSPQVRINVDHLVAPGRAGRTLFYLEPRLLAEAQLLPERLRLKLALGRFHQAPQGAELSPRFGNPDLSWQVGTTYVLGLDLLATRTLGIEAAGFYRDLRFLVVPDLESGYAAHGQGRAYGAELLLRQQLFRGLFGWIAYTLSRSERRDAPGEPFRPSRFDQTHLLTVVASYQLPVWGLLLGVRFRYATGSPTTPVVGGVRDLNRNSYAPLHGEPGSARLPDFHQLDVRIDRTFTFRKWRLGLYLDLQNVYNRRNTEFLVYGGRQLSQVGRVSGLPFVPNLGARADF